MSGDRSAPRPRPRGMSRQVQRALERANWKATDQAGRRMALALKQQEAAKKRADPEPPALVIPRDRRRRNARISAICRMVARTRTHAQIIERASGKWKGERDAFEKARPLGGVPGSLLNRGRKLLGAISNKRAKAMLVGLYPKDHRLAVDGKWAWQIVKGIGDASALKTSQPADDSATPG